MWPEGWGPEEKRGRGRVWRSEQGPDHSGGNLGSILKAMGATDGV